MIETEYGNILFTCRALIWYKKRPEEGCVDFNSESDDDGVHLTEGDFTLADGTQSLVDADLTYQYKLALSLSIFPRIRTIRNGLDVAFRQGSC